MLDDAITKDHSVAANPVIDPEALKTGALALAGLAAGLDTTTRVTTRLRPDGVVEVAEHDRVLGYVDHVPPVFVAYVGATLTLAVEVAQRTTMRAAVEAIRHSEVSA